MNAVQRPSRRQSMPLAVRADDVKHSLHRSRVVRSVVVAASRVGRPLRRTKSAFLRRCLRSLCAWLCATTSCLAACARPDEPHRPEAATAPLRQASAVSITPATYVAPPPPPPPTQAVSESELVRRLNAAGAGGGEVQVSLAWTNVNDLDLHVRTPCGTISYQNRSACGLTLDVDMNIGPNTNQPVENVKTSGRLRAGVYTVYVDYFRRHVTRGNPSEFAVRTIIHGETKMHSGEIHATEKNGRKHLVTQFTID